MGVPSRKDIDALIKRIDELSAKTGTATAKPARTVAKKAPAKRAAPRKAA
jgi:hypothetical protein